MTFSRDVRLAPTAFPAGPGISASAAGHHRGGTQRAALAIPRGTLMFREMEKLCYPTIADARAIPTGTVMLRLALARQPLTVVYRHRSKRTRTDRRPR